MVSNSLIVTKYTTVNLVTPVMICRHLASVMSSSYAVTQLYSEVDMRMMSATLIAVTVLAGAGLAKADAAAGWKAFHADDYAKAIKEFMPRVEQGDAAAQYWVGIVYYDERSDLQDYDEAEKWFRKAAEKGVVDANAILARCTAKAMDFLRTTSSLTCGPISLA
jgi:hypothetical protein